MAPLSFRALSVARTRSPVPELRAGRAGLAGSGRRLPGRAGAQEWPGSCPLLQGNFLDPCALRAWTEKVAPGWPHVLMAALVWSGLPSSAWPVAFWPWTQGPSVPPEPPAGATHSGSPAQRARPPCCVAQVCPLPTSATAPAPRPLPGVQRQLSGHSVWRSWLGWPTTFWCLQRASHSLGRRRHTGPKGHWGSEDPGVARPSSLTGKPCWPISAHSLSVPHTMAGRTQGAPGLGAGSKARLATTGTLAIGLGLTWSPQPGSGTGPLAWGGLWPQAHLPSLPPAPTSPPSLS